MSQIASKNDAKQTELTPSKQMPKLADILDYKRTKFDLENADIALLNLLCAVGLPGAENLDIPCLLDKLDEWAEMIRLETEKNYYRFIESPEQFEDSQAYFCVLYMATVLEQKCGVHYNPKWKCITLDKPVPEEFGRNAKDQFI
jgi:hypothetical protein